jgi:hypothetical protein
MSDEEKATIWRMTRAGSNWVQISRHLGRHVSAVLTTPDGMAVFRLDRDIAPRGN